MKGPFQSELHNQHDEGDAFRPGYWDSLPDFAELANGCRYRDGRDDNPFDAPREVYPHLVLMLSHCKAILLRQNICDFLMIDSDTEPIVDGNIEFRERALNQYFGRRREVWPYLHWKDKIYDFSRVAEWIIESFDKKRLMTVIFTSAHLVSNPIF